MAESSPPNALRLFLALRPDPLARVALAVHARYWTWGAQSVPHVPQDWHLTLHFIGPVPQTQCDALANALDVPMAPHTQPAPARYRVLRQYGAVPA